MNILIRANFYFVNFKKSAGLVTLVTSLQTKLLEVCMHTWCQHIYTYTTSLTLSILIQPESMLATVK